MNRSAGPASAPLIGVLDSGVGGLSILRALRQELPAASFIYIADQIHLPYGPRPLDEIRQFAHGIARLLLDRGARAIVVACNAASAASLLYLRQTFPGVPFVGMEPAVKPAAAATHTGRVGVLTTAATAGGPLYARVLDRFAANIDVRTVVWPELVLAVEANRIALDDLRPIFDRDLAPLLAEGVDQLVLACTHFPFAAQALRAYVGPDVTIVDPSPAVARQTRHVLPDHAPDSSNIAQAALSSVDYCTTGDRAHFAEVASALLGESIQARQLTWQADGSLALD
jgi:glutamate racemase